MRLDQLQQQEHESVMARIGTRLMILLWRNDFEFCELLSGAIMLGWGVWLLLPWSTFGSSLSYLGMVTLASVITDAPEILWGVLLAWTGFTEVGALLVDHRRTRIAASIGAAMIWAFMAATFAYSNPYGTGLIVYPWLALAAGWSALRIVATR